MTCPANMENVRLFGICGITTLTDPFLIVFKYLFNIYTAVGKCIRYIQILLIQ